jgi:hypothetical protein
VTDGPGISSDPWTGECLSAKDIATRGAAFARGETKAEAVALGWQQIADGLADMLDGTKTLVSWLPCPDLGDWFTSHWPEAGVDRDIVLGHLRAALAGAYAFAGAYGRAAGQMGEAILAHQHDVAARTGKPVSEVADTASVAEDAEIVETAGT